MSQIEARLPLWDDDQLRWVGEYLERKTIKPAEEKKGAHTPGSAAFVMAAKANTIATVALIIAIGAMIAASAAGLVAFQALQH